MSRPIHLLRHWSEVAPRIRKASGLQLFLDFDGTLAPLVARPEQAAIGVRTRKALRALARRRCVQVIVISGRRRKDLAGRTGAAVECWGLFGWERRPGQGLEPVAKRRVAEARDRLARLLAGLPGVRLEKGFAFAIHTLGAPSWAARRALERLRREATRSTAWVHVLGTKVWNVVPREIIGKGAAVHAAAMAQPAGVLSLYVGDDPTDEPAFAALPRGITARVGVRRDTYARYWLRSPEQVCQFLEALDEELR